MSEPRLQEIELEEHEVEPLRVMQIGVSPREGQDPAGFHLTALTDLSQREDLIRLIEAHRTRDGDCTTVWAGRPEHRKSLMLLVTFKEPLKAKAILEFDLIRHGPLLDLLIDGRSLVQLIPGAVGEDLTKVQEEERPSLRIEITAEFPREKWEELWSEVISEELEIPRNEAVSRMQLAQREIRLRATIPGFPPLDRLAGIFVDDEEKNVVFVTKDLITNRLRRDAQTVSESFDKFFWSEVEQLSDEFSLLSAKVVPALAQAGRSGDELTWNCGQLIGNALNGVVAALELIRLGYRLQPGIVLRTAIETVCTAAHLFQIPSDLGKFMGGKLKSTDSVNEAKTIVPFIAQLWGHLSNEYTHLGDLHRRLQLTEIYESADDPAAKTNLMAVHLAMDIVWIIAELVFYDAMDARRYWRRVELGKYEFDIHPDIRRKMGDIAGRLSVASKEATDGREGE